MEERKTSITDLTGDELSCVFIIVAQSGAQHLAKVVTVCRLFLETGKREDVLRAVKFNRVDVSEENHRSYQQINGLISLAAEAGNSTAQCIFARIILISCSKMSWPDFKRFDNPDHNLEYWICTSQVKLLLDICQTQAFISQLNLKSSCTSKGLFHYHFVKTFLSQCSSDEFFAMYKHLNCYKAYYRRNSYESSSSIREMCNQCNEMRGCKCWQKRRMGGNPGGISAAYNFIRLSPSKRRTLLLAEFERLRSQALLDLDAIFLAAIQ